MRNTRIWVSMLITYSTRTLQRVHRERCFRLQMMAPFQNRSVCTAYAPNDQTTMARVWHEHLAKLCSHSWPSVKSAIQGMKVAMPPHTCEACLQLWCTAVDGLEEMLDVKLADEAVELSRKRKR